MKQNTLLLLAASFALAACVAEPAPENPSGPKAEFIPGPTSFSVYAEGEPVPVPKAVIGQNGNNKPQTFWEDGDAISVFTSADGEIHSGKSYKFTTSLQQNATSADFTLAEEKEFGSGMYLAAYPYRNNTRGVNFTTYRMAGNQIPASQTLVAGSFDRNAALAVAFSEGSASFSFKNATALLKFRVSESNIVAGRVEVDPGDAISGTFRADFDATTKQFLGLETYSGAQTFNYVDFTINGSTPLETGTDYYVAVRPTALTSDLKIYLNGNLVKTINASQLPSIERNGIYNLGTLTTPATPGEKKLFFDFTVNQADVDPTEGWPTEKDQAATNAEGGLHCTYNLYGVPYVFTLADCSGASGRRIFWSNTNTYGHRIVFYAAERYLGTPAIEGYKLVQIRATSSRLDNTTASETLEPKIGIVSNIVASKATPTYVTGGELQTWAAGNNHEAYDYELSGTANNTVYYLYAKVKGAVQTLTLTYVPI